MSRQLKLQFSIRFLLLLLLLSAFFFGYALHAFRQLRSIESASNRLKENNLVRLEPVDRIHFSILQRSIANMFGIRISEMKQHLAITADRNLKSLSELSNLPNVVELTLSECRSLTNLAVLPEQTEVNRLTLNDCRINSFDGIQRLKNLQSLTIRNCDGFSSFDGLELTKGIKHLSIECEFSSELLSVDGIGSLCNLEELEVYTDRSTAARVFKQVGTLTQLKKLVLVGGRDIDGAKPLKDLKNLKTLVLDGVNLDSQTISSFTSLKTLILRSCTIGMENDLKFLASLKRLESIELSRSGNSFLRLDGIESLSGLRSLRLYPANDLEDLTSLTQLIGVDKLDLSGLGADSIPESISLPNLKTLSLRECPNLSDLNFLKQAQALERIEIENCEKLEDVKFLFSCPNLEVVFARGCPNVGTELAKLPVAVNCELGPRVNLKRKPIVFLTRFRDVYP